MTVKKNKYINVITAFNNDIIPSMVMVVKSDDDLSSDIINSIQELDIRSLPFYFDIDGNMIAKDIIINNLSIKKISYDNEFTTCKLTLNN